LEEHVAMKFQMENTEDSATLYNNLATHIKETGDIESVVEKLRKFANISFKIFDNTKKIIKQKIGPMEDRGTYR